MPTSSRVVLTPARRRNSAMRRLAVRSDKNSAVAAAEMVLPDASLSSSAFSIGESRRIQSMGASSANMPLP